MGSAQGYSGNKDRTVADDIIDACERAKVTGKQPPILLIDELDKANKDFFTIWNNIFDEGQLRRNGYHDSETKQEVPPKVVDFTGIDIFSTANFAQYQIKDYLAGKHKVNDDDMDKMREMIEEDAKRKDVRPDFWGRFNAIIPYRNLTARTVADITDKKLHDVKEFYHKEYGVHLDISPEAQQKLLEKGVDEDKGCRKLDNSVIDGGTMEATQALIDAERDKETLGHASNDRIVLKVKDGDVRSEYINSSKK